MPHPPIIGRDRIEEVLTTYQDAIQYNHDQAVRHMLKGATPEELRTGLVELPEFLDIDPFTRQMYGDVRNNAAQQFTGYLGWFTGDTTTIAPTPKAERDRRLVALAGGRDRILAEAEQALANDDPQWAAELASMLVSLGTSDMQARNLQAAGLRTLGYREQNALRRNWYLTGALELEGTIDVVAMSQMAAAAFTSGALPKAQIENLRYRVDPDQAGSQSILVRIETTDTNDVVNAHLRNSVLRVSSDPTQTADATIRLTRASLSQFTSGARSLGEMLDSNEASVEGDAAAATAFADAFDLTPPVVQLHLPNTPA